MNKQTYYLIADIIQRYRTWIIVKDTELLVEMRSLDEQTDVLPDCRHHTKIQNMDNS